MSPKSRDEESRSRSGFWSLALILAGIISAGIGFAPGVFLIPMGIVILVYALWTGKAKVWG